MVARIHESGDLTGAAFRTPFVEKEEAVKRSLAVLVVALLIPHLAVAQDVPATEERKADAAPPSPADTRQTDPVVVTATKVDTPQSHLGAAVTIIGEDELRTFNYAGAEEALRSVPGVEIARSGSLGKTTSIRIRGANPEQVIVLVDGLRVSSPTQGLSELSELTLDGIDRIEVVRGPQSTLYGADAIGGVVNIITKKGQGPPQASLWIEGGSYGTIREQANVQGSFGGFNYNLSGSRYDTRGHLTKFDNDDSDLTSFNGRIGYDFPWKGELSLSGRYLKLNNDLPIGSTNPVTVFDPNSQSQSETYLYTLLYKQPVFSWWDVSLRYSQYWNNTGFQNQPPPGSSFTNSQIDTRRQEAEFISSFHVGGWNTLTVGYENRAEQARNRGSFRAAVETNSGFVQDEIRLFDRLFVSGGVRYEDNSAFGSELTPRVAVAVLIKETGTKIRGTWGKGFRAPTLNELFFPNFGNPDLQPERSESYDVGFDQKFWQNRIRFGSTFFHNRFSNLIQFVSVPGTFLLRPENVASAITQGVETYLEVEPLDWILFWANHTTLDTEDLNTHRPLRRFANNRWNTGVTLTPIERLSMFIQAHVVSKQFESPTQGRNPGYYRIDVGGTYRLFDRVGHMDKLEFTARIDNMTNESYTETFGFPAQGLTALFGLRAYFR
jgi:vitamin B12 transporter